MASGDSLGFWDALSSRPPGGGAPVITGINNDIVIMFDPASDNTTYFFGYLPSSYGGGNLQVHLFWNTTDDTADNIKIDVAFERRQPGTYDFDNGDDFGTDSSTLITVSDDTLLNTTMIVITAANAGTPVAGEPFRLRVRRDADDGTDTFADQWLLVGIKMLEA